MKNYPQVKSKAKRLVATNSVFKVDETTFQIPSASKVDQVHIVSNGECDCMGFRMNKICSHSEAVKLFIEKNKDKIIQ